MAEVVLENVSRRYPGGTLAVDRLALAIHDKELLVLVGPSGCGKSTTLRLIAGLEELTEGSIRIDGRLVNHVRPRDRDIAMVFQNGALYPHLTVQQNLAFGLKLRYGGGWASRVVRRVFRPRKARQLAEQRRTIGHQVHAAAQTLGIEHLLERLPRQLSGGERQRVALGRALVRRPAVFLFDEPLSNLDARLRVDMRRELKQLHQRLQATMVYVTHDQVEALTLGGRVAVMDRGTIQQVGPALEVYEKPTNLFVAGFMGTPAMNFIEGERVPADGQPCFQAGGFRLHLPQPVAARLPQEQRKVVLGIRPEHVAIGRGTHPARVVLVEPVGDASLVRLQLEEADSGGHCGPVEITSKAGAQVGLVPGERVLIELDRQRLHWFEPGSGKSLTS